MYMDVGLSNNTRAQDHKTEIGDQTQLSSIWLAEMATSHHFSQSDAWDLSLVSSFSFMILDPALITETNKSSECKHLFNRLFFQCTKLCLLWYCIFLQGWIFPAEATNNIFVWAYIRMICYNMHNVCMNFKCSIGLIMITLNMMHNSIKPLSWCNTKMLALILTCTIKC
jgi:hypothetical protein